jgi:uncharacterized damage-inducible protein DinB
MAKPIVELFAHNLWANSRIINICADLSDELLDASASVAYGSVRNTLVQILVNEEFYVGLLTRRQPAVPLFTVEGFPGFEELHDRAIRTGTALIDVAGKQRPNQMLKGTSQGRPYEMPAAMPLIQAINHATENRAQIVRALTEHGVNVPPLDAWAYWQQGLVHSHAHDQVHDHEEDHEHAHEHTHER